MNNAHTARIQSRLWTLGVTFVGNALLLRDRLLQRIPTSRGTAVVTRHAIPSGSGTLDAVLVQPQPTVELQAAVLICHGIGETVEFWIRAQELMATRGIASLVFNYTGCGRSTGPNRERMITPEACERDAIAAFGWLKKNLPATPITLLGFSLGTGVATAVAERIPIQNLVLCEAYTSFRAAIRAGGAPNFIAQLSPNVWRSVETLRTCPVPLLVVHGACDRLFPVSMGQQLAAAAPQAKLAVIPGMGHSDLHTKARPHDWSPALEWILQKP